MKFPMMYEKMATPKKRTKAPTSLSRSLRGLKSPKPTVDKEVKAKYVVMTDISAGVFSLNPK